MENIPESFFDELTPHPKSINFFAYKNVSEYPSSTRDFSFSIHDLGEVNTVISILEEVSDNMIKDSFIFDFYKNEKNK